MQVSFTSDAVLKNVHVHFLSFLIQGIQGPWFWFFWGFFMISVAGG